MATDSGLPMAASPGLTELLGRAITDSGFRELLYRDRASATQEYDLSDADLVALDNLLQERLEEHVKRFSSTSGVATTVGVAVSGHFDSRE